MSALAGTCARTRGLFAAYVAESLSREERTDVRMHLAACPACRGAAASTDPALIFTVLATSQAPDGSTVSTVSAADTAKILAGVRAGIALKTAEKRLRAGSRDGSRSRLSWRRPAMTAAAAVAAVALAWTLGPRQPSASGSASTGARTVAPAVSALAAPASSANASENANASSLRPASLVPATDGGAIEPVNIDRKSPADATIYDWNPGGGQPRVVWIVDRSLDI